MKTSRILQVLCAALVAVAVVRGGAGLGPTGTGIWILPNIVDPTEVDVESESFVLIPFETKTVDTSSEVTIVLPPELTNSTGTRYADGEDPKDIPVSGRQAILLKSELNALVAEGIHELVVVFSNANYMTLGRLQINVGDPEKATGTSY